jgi:hypothetical protein
MLLAALGASGHDLFAQGTDASIRGVVADSAGAAVAGAIVEVRNTTTGFVSVVRSSDRGRYVATQLPLGGPYRITARAVGFRTGAREGITLNIGSVVTADFRLIVGTVQLTEVTVSAEPARVVERNGAVTRVSLSASRGRNDCGVAMGASWARVCDPRNN